MRKIHRFGLLVGLLLVGALVVAAYPAPVLAGAHPIACYGDVSLGGSPAPVGTAIGIYIGADATPSATTTVTTAGQYGPVQLWADESRHGQALSYKVNGFPATTNPANPVFGWGNQEVDLEGINGPHTWTFSTAGFFPKHLPDVYTGQVVLADLDPADIPAQVQGVWWYDGPALEWKFWVPGAGGDLTTLGGGHTYDYMVLVSGACEWEILLP